MHGSPVDRQGWRKGRTRTRQGDREGGRCFAFFGIQKIVILLISIMYFKLAVLLKDVSEGTIPFISGLS